MVKPKKVMRIGIYSGTFNPVHAGHIAFALQSLTAANLDMVYFLPERRPRSKSEVEHFAHRMAMIRRAVQPHLQLGLLDLVDVNFSVQRTLPHLQQEFDGAKLVFLMGSDVAPSVPSWPHADQLLATSELVIGVRAGDDMETLKATIASWPKVPQAITMFDSFAPTVSSSTIRQALQNRQAAAGLLPSVQRYSNHHWLYVSVA